LKQHFTCFPSKGAKKFSIFFWNYLCDVEVAGLFAIPVKREFYHSREECFTFCKAFVKNQQTGFIHFQLFANQKVGNEIMKSMFSNSTLPLCT